MPDTTSAAPATSPVATAAQAVVGAAKSAVGAERVSLRAYIAANPFQSVAVVTGLVLLVLAGLFVVAALA